MGAAASTVYYNLKLRHPTLDMPVIDYDLALLFQPMLMLGISIGVAFNVIFADWMVTVLLIILFVGNFLFLFWGGGLDPIICVLLLQCSWCVLSLQQNFHAGTSTKACLKGIETWKKETLIQKVESF